MKSIIIEDQAPARHILQKYIGNTKHISIEKTFCDALEAKDYLKENPVDLIFLDIDLPRFSGMDFLRSEQNHPLTILTTAYSEFALESYQYNVIDYLLKPFSFERFSQAIDKVVALTTPKQMNETQEAGNESCVYIKSSHNLLKIKRNEILFIRSDSDYTEVVTASNIYLTSDALKEWVAKLDDDFTQVHKSYIINTAHLTKISHNKVYLPFNQIIPIGRAFKKDLMERVTKHVLTRV